MLWILDSIGGSEGEDAEVEEEEDEEEFLRLIFLPTVACSTALSGTVGAFLLKAR